jgi:hypothetical protein
MKFKKIILTFFLFVMAVSIGAFVVRAEVTSTTSTSSRKILPVIRKNFEQKDIRNTNLEQRERRLNAISSSTERMRELRASTTMMFKAMKNKKADSLKKMKMDAFLTRKDALEKELRLSIMSITKIRETIAQRITRIENSTTSKSMRDMTEARKALAVADEKIAKAKTAIDLFSNTVFTPATGRVSTSTEVTLDKPRKIGNDAIVAVKDARDSLKKVIDAVSHSLGLKVGNTAASTSN